jgi:hypothetical protein
MFARAHAPALAHVRTQDLPCRRLGVHPEPEVTEVDLGPEWGAKRRSGGGGAGGGGPRSWGWGGKGAGCDELMILIASDGVWEYMDNQEAVDVLAGQPDASAGAAALVSAAVDRWQAVDPSYIDDITVVVARLHRGQ